MAESFEPGTPQAAAVAWAEAVMAGDGLLAVWPGTDPTLRLVLAQDWLWNHRHDADLGEDQDRDAAAGALASCPPDHPLWDRFATDLVAMWRRTWKGFEPSRWHVKPQPEVLDLDLEMVTFVDRGSALARRFAMRHGPDGWKVASINGDQLFEPGWPPKLGRGAGQP